MFPDWPSKTGPSLKFPKNTRNTVDFANVPGLLPKYRLLVEKLTARGLVKVVSGTWSVRKEKQLREALK